MSSLRRVFMRVPVCAAERARARLLEVAPDGFEERDVDGDMLELGVYVPEVGVDALLAELPGARVEHAADGWEDAWRAFHRPVVAGGLWLGPPWEPPPDPARAVVIDPGRAFGTGAHPTTRLCVELLAATGTRGSLLDLGCGSGILALVAVRLGFAPVLAVDVDPVAVEATRANARFNGLEVGTAILDAMTDPLPTADVAVANVLLRPVETILGRLVAHEAITSGYLAGERPGHDGWAHVEALELDGWAADRFRRPRSATIAL